MPYLTPNSQFSITGQNMNLIGDIRFGDIFVEDLQYIDTTGVSGTVPINAFTSEVTASTSHGQYSLGEKYIVLTSADQVEVGTLPKISGLAGNIFTVTGENFYQITDVKFGEKAATFNLVDADTVEAIIPEDADYTGVTVFSSLRTGLNNNQSLASGLSVDEFIPIPSISGLDSFQLCSGESLSITGHSMGGVTGIRFAGNDNLISAAALSPNTITSTIPSGNIRGRADLLLPSGQFSKMQSSFALSPLAKVTGVGNSFVGISSEKPAGSTGTLLLVSGENFGEDILYRTGDNYLGSIMGQTGEFKMLSDTVVSGMIPTGINISLSGGNASVAPTISSGIVSLFSDAYPESYPSEVYFTPTIGAPKITSVSPSSGIVGDTLSVLGNDLYGITGVNLMYGGGNVGVGTFDAGTIEDVVPGFELNFNIGNAASLGSVGEFYDVVLSGHFGSVTGTNAFFALGSPTVSSIDPNTEVVPGSSGLMLGTCLYSGAKIELWTGAVTPASYEFFSELPSSGYDTTNHDEIKFQYPATFPSGVNFKVRARNRRAISAVADNDSNITALLQPFLSGFEPISGEYGDTITVSGYFENIISSGLKIGSSTVFNFNQSSTTGFNFVIPDNASTDTIAINTSGGALETTGFLSVFPSKPRISGYFSGAVAPAVIDYSQVFKDGDSVTVSGAGMNLVTAIRFSGESGTFDLGSFNQRNFETISFNAPGSINGESGKFQLIDAFGRITDSNATGINLISISGFTNYLLPAETLDITGYNITGMDILFHHPTGGYVTALPYSNTLIGEGLESIKAQIPTGITYGALKLTGRQNDFDAVESFYPLGVITGISGANINNVENLISPLSGIRITGINTFDPNLVDNNSGDGISLVGFTGMNLKGSPYVAMPYPYEGQTLNQLFPIRAYSTGIATIGGVADTFYTAIDVDFVYQNIGSGSMFIIDSWWRKTFSSRNSITNSQFNNYFPSDDSTLLEYADFTFPSPSLNPAFDVSGSGFVNDYQVHAFEVLDKKTSFYPGTPSGGMYISGDNFYVTGFGPLMGRGGDTITLSGAYLDRVNSVSLERSDNYTQGQKQFVAAQILSGSTSDVLEFSLPSFLEAGGENRILMESIGSGYPAYAYHTGFTPDLEVRSGEVDGVATIGGSGMGLPLSYVTVLEDAPAEIQSILPTGTPAPQGGVGVTVNYTSEEMVNGVVFLVTRTKFPDGTTMVVSSVPKP